MCIRDRHKAHPALHQSASDEAAGAVLPTGGIVESVELLGGCLLYTSDAADERSSVDFGGRRVIKKKKTEIKNNIGTDRAIYYA